MGELVPVQIKGNVGTIEDNLDQVELSIHEKVQEYGTVVVTEHSVKEGKKLLADIRKEKKSLDDERKEIKSQWMAPYEAFEKRAKQIIALYDKPIGIIDSQLDEFEKRRKAEKRKEIEAVYDLVKGDLADWLPLEKIYDPKWENATCSTKKIRGEMEKVFDQTRISISTIKSLGSEFEADALCVLKETGDLQEAIAEIGGLQKQKERFVEQAECEAERRRQEKERVEERLEGVAPASQGGEGAFTVAGTQERSGGPADGVSKLGCQSGPEIPYRPKRFPFAPGLSASDIPSVPEDTLTVIVRIGEHDLSLLKDFLDMAGLEYEVM